MSAETVDGPTSSRRQVPWREVLEATGVMGAVDIPRSLAACWARTRSSDIAQRCVLAHYLGDHQPTDIGSLLWDLRALSYGRRLPADALVEIGITDAARLLPSLHLNAAEAYRRLGDVRRARFHAGEAQRAADRVRTRRDPIAEHPLDAATADAVDRLIDRLSRRPGAGSSPSPEGSGSEPLDIPRSQV